MILNNTQIYFVLSGEAEFTEQGTYHDFRGFYNKRLEILSKGASGKRTSRRHEELLRYFNESLFPDQSKNQASIYDAEELDLMKALDDEDEAASTTGENDNWEDNPGSEHAGPTGIGEEDHPIGGADEWPGQGDCNGGGPSRLDRGGPADEDNGDGS